MKELFENILENYNNGYKKADASDPMYGCLRYDIPNALYSLFPFRKEFLFVGSSGKGAKTYYPWVAILNKNVTSSTTKGLYIVYLFKSDLSGFYLSLNQGITFFDNTYGRDKYRFAKKTADYFREQIEDNYFSRENIDLVAEKKDKLGYGYQETNIISKYYEKGCYADDELESDLKRMIIIYDEIVGQLAEQNYNYDNAVENILFDENEVIINADEAIEKIKESISEPTDVNVIRELKYKEPVAKHLRKYEKMRNRGAIYKVDYIKQASIDAKTGQLGEMLALQYEKEKLIKAGQDELADKVRQVSVKSDRFGYDIISYELIDGEYQEVYIEVKTTLNKYDVAFPVSRNEVETSNEKGKNYCVFRIYNVKDPNPNFYKTFGKIEDHFDLDPITYLATFKG